MTPKDRKCLLKVACILKAALYSFTFGKIPAPVTFSRSKLFDVSVIYQFLSMLAKGLSFMKCARFWNKHTIMM